MGAAIALPIVMAVTAVAKMIADQGAADAQRKKEAIKAKYSPWTGMMPSEIQEPNPVGDIAAATASGVQAYQGYGDKALSTDLTKAQTAALNKYAGIPVTGSPASANPPPPAGSAGALGSEVAPMPAPPIVAPPATPPPSPTSSGVQMPLIDPLQMTNQMPQGSQALDQASWVQLMKMMKENQGIPGK